MKIEMTIKNKDYLYDLNRCMLLALFQLIASIFLLLIIDIFFKEKYEIFEKIVLIFVIIILISLSYFQINRIKNCILYFLPKEVYKIENGVLYYYKILKIFKLELNLKKFLVNLSEIEGISYTKPRKFFYIRASGISIFWYLIYFKPLERVCIEQKNGRKKYVLNYVKKPDKYFDVFAENNESELEFKKIFQKLEEFINNGKKLVEKDKNIEKSNKIYSLIIEERYNIVLEKIIREKIFFITKMEEKIIINGYREAIENLEIFKNMEWEEINFYNFYVNYLSKKENEDKIVLVGYNGIDGKEVTMSILKDDINEIRDSKSTFKD